MSNRFGKLFTFTTWGESHGEAIGCVIDGCPSLVPLDENDIQIFLNRRMPGQSKFTTQRKEKDQVKILSGVFEGKTTGTPISLIIYNNDHRTNDYSDTKDKFRPSHGDYTYFNKYGIRDYRGGGRSSARETASRVMAGAVAIKILKTFNIEIIGYLKQIGEIAVDENNIDYNEINQNDLFCPDKDIIAKWQDYLLNIRKKGDSVGAIIEVIAKNIPSGLGEPIYNKLDSAISSALMSINAVKSVEIGTGAKLASFKGSESSDEIETKNNKTNFLSNNSGGVLAGISSGQDIVARFSVKPTSSILVPRKTIDINNNNTSIITKGRHDPCVGIRAVPVGEAMIACVLLDHLLLKNAYNKLI